jgi:hypothetical protein
MAPAATATAGNVHAHLCSFLLFRLFLAPDPQQNGKTGGVLAVVKSSGWMVVYKDWFQGVVV